MKICSLILCMVGVVLGLSSCAEPERRPVPPSSNSSEQTWNKMEKFEENAVFGPINRRR